MAASRVPGGLANRPMRLLLLLFGLSALAYVPMTLAYGSFAWVQWTLQLSSFPQLTPLHFQGAVFDPLTGSLPVPATNVVGTIIV